MHEEHDGIITHNGIISEFGIITTNGITLALGDKPMSDISIQFGTDKRFEESWFDPVAVAIDDFDLTMKRLKNRFCAAIPSLLPAVTQKAAIALLFAPKDDIEYAKYVHVASRCASDLSVLEYVTKECHGSIRMNKSILQDKSIPEDLKRISAKELQTVRRMFENVLGQQPDLKTYQQAGNKLKGVAAIQAFIMKAAVVIPRIRLQPHIARVMAEQQSVSEMIKVGSIPTVLIASVKKEVEQAGDSFIKLSADADEMVKDLAVALDVPVKACNVYCEPLIDMTRVAETLCDVHTIDQKVQEDFQQEMSVIMGEEKLSIKEGVPNYVNRVKQPDYECEATQVLI